MTSVFNRCDEFWFRIALYWQPYSERCANVRDYYRIMLTYTSNAIEGNSLTFDETKTVIETGELISDKPEKDSYEAIGHAKAFDYMYEISRHKNLEVEDILTMHLLYYEDIDRGVAGIFRTKRTNIQGSNYPVASPENISALLDGFVSWFNRARETMHPARFAALVQQKFIFIHPFYGGNGRIARLLMNLALMRILYSPAIILPELRREYFSALEQSHKDAEVICKFTANCILETETNLLQYLKEQGCRKNTPELINADETKFENTGTRIIIADTVEKDAELPPQRVKSIYHIIGSLPGITVNTLSQMTGETLSAVKKEIMQLQSEGKIEFRGAKKTEGYYSLIPEENKK